MEPTSAEFKVSMLKEIIFIAVNAFIEEYL
jgi:hypothetical protein